MIDETKKIMEDDSLRITATTVRVPVYRSHAESINVEFEREVSLDAARKALAAFPGVILRDNPSEQEYPMPLFTSGKTDVEIGRHGLHGASIDEDISMEGLLAGRSG